MRRFAQRLQALFAPSTFVLLGAICTVGIVPADVACQDYISSEAEESKVISEFDDVDLQIAIVNTQVTLILGHGFDEWLKIEHRSASLSHSWDCSSRGPPKT